MTDYPTDFETVPSGTRRRLDELQAAMRATTETLQRCTASLLAAAEDIAAGLERERELLRQVDALQAELAASRVAA